VTLVDPTLREPRGLDVALTVLEAGWATSSQDLGRPGWAHLGVARAGAMDPASATLANRLVGNPQTEAVFETAGGLRLRAERSLAIAVTGARVPVTVDGHPAPWDAPVLMRAGADVALGHPPLGSGRWAYVAVRGGLDLAAELGSRSWDSLGGLGPTPPRPGQRLGIGPEPDGAMPVDLAPLAPLPAGILSIRVWPGPRSAALSPDQWRRLTTAAWTVGADSDRIGLRLDGPATTRAGADDLASEGLVPGAVQVPRDGRPIVMMRDHPTTGGYPVVAVVDPEDLASLAQRQPGEAVLLVPVSEGRRSL